MQGRSFWVLAALAAIAWFLYSLLSGNGPDSPPRGNGGNASRQERNQNSLPQSKGTNSPLRDDGANSSAGNDGAAAQGFDFYVLSLSWSPSYCASEGPRADRQQCSSGRPYSFVAHGLWPQYESGYPQDCQIGDRYVPQEMISSVRDIMPSKGLIIHEWRKHGRCTGLSQSDYFSTLRRAYEGVTIPASFRNMTTSRDVDPMLVEKAFVAANPGLPAGGISVTCEDGYLQDVRICMTKDLQFRNCGEVDAAACRRRSVNMPPVR
ncbi:ribonuclease T [Phyllobacterium salinisoli]|uniref:Ribonuclease T n=1 Tax=Phyllobacterium salinisoli TaxID=1899321 RepID=A0A368K175_9HYPH|nr:ribonuclease T [Phyllobacterium salinisoli]RCS23148.1 ribonuclease T [Phyllobacterium salinisoli]